MATALSQLTAAIRGLETDSETRYRDYPDDFREALEAIRNNEKYAPYLKEGTFNNEEGVCTSFNILARKVNPELCVPETRRVVRGQSAKHLEVSQRVHNACKDLSPEEARQMLAQMMQIRAGKPPASVKTAEPSEVEISEALARLKGELHNLERNANTLFKGNLEGLEVALLLIKQNEKYAPFFTAGFHNNEDGVGAQFNGIARRIGKPELYVVAPVPVAETIVENAPSTAGRWWGSRALSAVRGAVNFVYSTTTASMGWLRSVMSWTPAEQDELIGELRRRADAEKTEAPASEEEEAGAVVHMIFSEEHKKT
jgi:hypothetical protein